LFRNYVVVMPVGNLPTDARNGQRNFLIQEFPYEGGNPGVRLTHVRRGSCAADPFACSDRLTGRRADNGTRYRCGPDQHDEEVEEIDQKSCKEKIKEAFC
jgi:hypothetical protein